MTDQPKTKAKEYQETWDLKAEFEAEVWPHLDAAYKRAQELGIPIVIQAQYSAGGERAGVSTKVHVDQSKKSAVWIIVLLAELLDNIPLADRIDDLIRADVLRP